MTDKFEVSNEYLHNLVLAQVQQMDGPAYDEERGGCVYRYPDGSPGCIVGRLMSDYKPLVEDTNAGCEDTLACLPFKLSGRQVDYLMQVQNIHDATGHSRGDVVAWRAEVSDAIREVAIRELKLGVIPHA